jgi:hypothetical protein
MPNSPRPEVEKPVFTALESGDRLEYCVAIDRPGSRRIIIPFFGDSRDAQNWIDWAGRWWRDVSATKKAHSG